MNKALLIRLAPLLLILAFSSTPVMADDSWISKGVDLWKDSVSAQWDVFSSIGDGMGWSLASSAIASVIGWIATVYATGVGVFAVMTFVLGSFQFLLGFLFGPIGLLLAPMDRGRVLGSTVSMMLSGIMIFVVAFTVLTVSVGLFSEAAQRLSERAIANGQGGEYKLIFAMSSIIYSYIMYQVVQQSNSWGAALFAGVGFNLQGMARSMGRAGAEGGAKIASTAGKAGAGTTKAGAGGAIGAVRGAGKGVKKGSFTGGGILKGAGGAITGAASGAVNSGRAAVGATGPVNTIKAAINPEGATASKSREMVKNIPKVGKLTE